MPNKMEMCLEEAIAISMGKGTTFKCSVCGKVCNHCDFRESYDSTNLLAIAGEDLQNSKIVRAFMNYQGGYVLLCSVCFMIVHEAIHEPKAYHS